MICIIDYGMGNLRSVCNALEHLDIPHMISDKTEDIESAKAVLIPGVGAFYDAMKNLKAKGLDVEIKRVAKLGKPILGICLGMQVLFDLGEEVETIEGLGLIDGTIKKLDIPYKVPHIGWNGIDPAGKNVFVKDTEYTYFVHSYYAETDKNNVIAYCDYGVQIPAIVNRDNIYGMQFHPEKSGDFGLGLIKRFWEEVVK